MDRFDPNITLSADMAEFLDMSPDTSLCNFGFAINSYVASNGLTSGPIPLVDDVHTLNGPAIIFDASLLYLFSPYLTQSELRDGSVSYSRFKGLSLYHTQPR